MTYQSINRRALLAISSVQVAGARFAVRVVEVAVCTRVTVGWIELHSALATSSFFLTVPGGVMEVAVACWRIVSLK